MSNYLKRLWTNYK